MRGAAAGRCSYCGAALPLAQQYEASDTHAQRAAAPRHAATLQSRERRPLCRKCSAALIEGLDAKAVPGCAGAAPLDSILSQLGLSLGATFASRDANAAEPQPAEPRAEARRNAVAARVDKAQKRTEREVSSWLSALVRRVERQVAVETRRCAKGHARRDAGQDARD